MADFNIVGRLAVCQRTSVFSSVITKGKTAWRRLFVFTVAGRLDIAVLITLANGCAIVQFYHRQRPRSFLLSCMGAIRTDPLF